MEKPLWAWALFIGVVIILLVFDLGFFNRKNKEIDVKSSLKLSLYYIIVAVLYGKWIWYYMGAESSKEFYTGFLIEKTLAVDNIFIISMIFTYFNIPRIYQHRVLFWGILGVVVLRAIMIGLRATLIENFAWIMIVFAVFLMITGVKMMMINDSNPDLSNNIILKVIKKYLPVTDEMQEERFVIEKQEKDGSVKKYFTPLFVALMMIEFVDLIFAVDSVPAIFAITHDVYIVYTSNIFAILGLRALYFALSAIIHRFHYLKYSVSIILVFIGLKIIYSEFYGKVPALYSLMVTVMLLAGGVVVSLYKTKKN
ncbi:MAG: TerC family protein [Alphaproteobacteria bacterium]|nr:TerC family protein [Alphaproteobacteria bacterium]